MSKDIRRWVEQRRKDPAFAQMVDDALRELQFSKAVVELRRELDVSQSELARMANVSQPYLAKFEKGKVTNPELKTLVAAATALGAKVEIRLKPRFRRS